MANERQELDRLRKMKRLRELEAREVQSGSINTDGIGAPGTIGGGAGLGLPGTGGPVGVGGRNTPQPVATTPAQPTEQEPGGIGEFFSGSLRATPATRELPELGGGGLLAGEDEAKIAAITPALLTTTDPFELGQVLSDNFDNIGLTQDEKGNFFASNNQTGAQVVLNKPGISKLDIMQGLGLAAAFTPAGRVAGGALKVGATAGATSAGIEALQALSGGEFDASQVAIDTVTAGVLDKAFEVAKATGRSIRDVLQKDANIDPDRLLRSFEPTGNVSRFARTPEEPVTENIGRVLETASQSDLTPEALRRIRQAEEQGVQLTKAQATGDFGSSEAEQQLLKSLSPEGEQARVFAESQQEQLKGAAEEFTKKFGGSSRFKESLGETVEDTARGKGELVQDVLQERKELGSKEVSELYTLAGETSGEALPLNNTSIVEIADDIIVNRPITPEVEKSINTALAKFGLIGDSVEQSTRNKFKVMDGDQAITITGDVTPLTLNNAEDFRKALNKAVGADQTGSAKSVVSELDKQIATVVDQGLESGRTDAFRTARGAAKEQFETFKAKDIIEDLTSFKRGTSTPKVDPETVINKIVKGDKAITNIRKIKKVLLESPTAQSKNAWRSIQAEAVGDILGQAINKDTLEISGARLNSAIKKFKPEVLRELLGRKQFTELKKLQKTIGTATIPPPGTTNPSGTFSRIFNNVERLGNFAGGGMFNFGSLAFAGARKGKELKGRKNVLDGIVNTKIDKIRAANPTMTNSQLNKAAKTLAFLEMRELDKEER